MTAQLEVAAAPAVAASSARVYRGVARRRAALLAGLAITLLVALAFDIAGPRGSRPSR